MTEGDFINKVKASGILTVDLNDFRPKEKSVFFDIKEHLYMGLMLKEKDFKESLAMIDWESFRNKPVAIGCSVDAIIPLWAYMVLADKLDGVTTRVAYTSPDALDLQLWKENIEHADFSYLQDKKVVVKADQQIAPALYLAVTSKLKPMVKSLMYGEAGLPKVICKR